MVIYRLIGRPFAWSVVGLLFSASLLVAQTPATQSARPAATGATRPTPRTPDFSGVWQVLNSAAWDLEDHNADIGTPPGESVVEGHDIPYQPWAVEKKKQNYARRLTEDTDVKCYMPGVPRITYMPYPFRIVQTPKYITFIYEYIHVVRTVYTDGSKHPEGIDWWMGDSRGHWEGDTLVVDVIDFNDQTTFDKAGNFHSDALHVVERYRLIDKDHLNYDVTIEDPKVFTRPWKISMPIYRRLEKNIRPLEYDCYAFEHVFHAPEPNQP